MNVIWIRSSVSIRCHCLPRCPQIAFQSIDVSRMRESSQRDSPTSTTSSSPVPPSHLQLYGAEPTPTLIPECVTCCCFLSSRAMGECRCCNRYTPTHFSQVNQYLTGVYYVASQHAECSPWYILGGEAAKTHKSLPSRFCVKHCGRHYDQHSGSTRFA